MTTETYATAEVFEPGLQALRDKAEALNKRATRHGMNKLDVTINRVKAFFPVCKGCIGPQQNLYVVDINGQAPRIDGWALAARVEFNDIIGNVVRIAPGRDDDGSYSSYRSIDPVCEHCNSKRRRNDVFILEHSDGRRKIVGRNCLADFLRCSGADAFADLAKYADLASQWAERAEAGDSDYFGGEGGGWGVRTMPLDRYLPVVRMLMHRIGWMGRTKARDFEGVAATADDAYRYLFVGTEATKDWIKYNDLSVSPADEAEAACAIEWACSVDSSKSEYLDTIKRIALSGMVDFKGLDGYAASIIIAYRNACEFQAERDEKAKSAKNKVWFGSPKERVKNVSVVCKGRHSFEGSYGTTTIVRFEHYPNNSDVAVLVWFASGDRFDDWEEGAEYSITATIKGHDDDSKYGKQTKINRVKV